MEFGEDHWEAPLAHVVSELSFELSAALTETRRLCRDLERMFVHGLEC
jgi:hypothetical protein